MDEKSLVTTLNALSVVLIVALVCDFAWVITTALHVK